MLFVVVIGWLASALFCAILANEKGYLPVAWFFGGLFFGFFALIAAAGLPDKKLRKYIREIEGERNSKEPQSDGDWTKKPASWDYDLS